MNYFAHNGEVIPTTDHVTETTNVFTTLPLMISVFFGLVLLAGLAYFAYTRRTRKVTAKSKK